MLDSAETEGVEGGDADADYGEGCFCCCPVEDVDCVPCLWVVRYIFFTQAIGM